MKIKTLLIPIVIAIVLTFIGFPFGVGWFVVGDVDLPDAPSVPTEIYYLKVFGTGLPLDNAFQLDSSIVVHGLAFLLNFAVVFAVFYFIKKRRK